MLSANLKRGNYFIVYERKFITSKVKLFELILLKNFSLLNYCVCIKNGQTFKLYQIIQPFFFTANEFNLFSLKPHPRINRKKKKKVTKDVETAAFLSFTGGVTEFKM